MVSGMRVTRILWVSVLAVCVFAAVAALWGPGPELRPEVKVRMLVVRADLSDPQDIERARRKIDQAYQYLEKGANFAQLVMNESEAMSAKDGGDMGWIGRGILSEELEEVAFRLEPGEYSEIIEQERAEDIVFRIIYVEDRRNF